MATFQVVDEFANYLGKKRDDLSADTFKAALCLTAPTKAGTQVLADVTQIAGTGGYAPVTLTSVTWTETGAGTGIWEFDSAAFSWTASGADFASARYVVIYNDTATSDELIGWYDYGSDITLANGETLTIDFDGTNGLLQIV